MDKPGDNATALGTEDGARAMEKNSMGKSKQLEEVSMNALERRIDQWFNENYCGDGSFDNPASIKNSKFMESLQVLCSKRGLSQPIYELNSQEGPPHLKKFTYQCSVDDKMVLAVAPSKTLCKHLAAQKMLKLLESPPAETVFLRIEEDDKLIKSQDRELKTEASNIDALDKLIKSQDHELKTEASNIDALAEPMKVLQSYCSKHKLLQPDYILIKEEGPPHLKQFTFECKVGKIVEAATSSSKTRAKHLVAKKILDKLESEQYSFDELSDEFQSNMSFLNSDPDNVDSSKVIVSKMFIQRLQKVCSDNNLPLPNYVIKNVTGPPHNRSFTCECSIGETIESATAQSKILSKHLAAEKMLKNVMLQIDERNLDIDYTDPISAEIDDDDDNDCEVNNKFGIRFGSEVIKYLQQLCSLKKLAQPIFSLIKEEVFSGCRLFTYECKVNDIVEVATDNSKKKAKSHSAEKVVEKLYLTGLLNMPNIGGKLEEKDSPSQVLIRFCAENLFSPPMYNYIDESGEGHQKEFICSCQVDDLIEVGSGSSKKQAKHNASSKVLEKLKSVNDFEIEDYSKVSCNIGILDLYADIQLKKSKKFPSPEVIDLRKTFINNPLALEVIEQFDETTDFTRDDLIKVVLSLVVNTKVCVEFEPLKSRNRCHVCICSIMPDPYIVAVGVGPWAKQKSAYKMMCMLKSFLRYNTLEDQGFFR